jgi:hypothetical protein
MGKNFFECWLIILLFEKSNCGRPPHPKGRGIRDPLRSRCNKIESINIYTMEYLHIIIIKTNKNNLQYNTNKGDQRERKSKYNTRYKLY